jgi:hypothetical protein
METRMHDRIPAPPAPLPGGWKMWLAAAAVLVSLLWIWHGQRSPFSQRPGAYANRTEVPLQDEHDVLPPFDFRGFHLVPVAHFEVRARLLMRTAYHLDRESALAPLDFALGWGRMADDAVLNRLALSQGGRFYFYHWDGAPPIAADEMVSSSANMHLIPASAEVDDRLRSLPVGDLVQLEGTLVDASKGSWSWRTSRTRTDTGAGACELFFVERASAY